MTDWVDDLQRAAADLAERARGAVVEVTAEGVGVGSGVLWAPGVVVTNAHVAGRGRLGVRFSDGSRMPARRRTSAPRLDLALLEVETSPAPSAGIGDSEELLAGDWVLAAGNPWGVRGAATAGVVIGREGPWLALSLHLRPGHSGGPLVNARGEVVGVNTMMHGPDVGLAIPSARVRRFMAEAGFGRAAGGLARAA